MIDKDSVEARVKKRFLAMAWIDYRKTYDMLPHHSWILETLGMIKVAKNIEGSAEWEYKVMEDNVGCKWRDVG